MNEDKKLEELVIGVATHNAYVSSKDGNTLNMLMGEFLNKSDVDKIHAFDDTRDKYIPGWYKKRENNITLKSRYNIPVKLNGNVVTFQEWVDTGRVKNAIIKARITQKPDAVYPVAFVVVEEGEEIDYFEGLE